jgi:hypothetical protein
VLSPLKTVAGWFGLARTGWRQTLFIFYFY